MLFAQFSFLCAQGQTLQSAGPRTRRPRWPKRAVQNDNKVQLGLKFNTQNEGNMVLNKNNWQSYTFPPSPLSCHVLAALAPSCFAYKGSQLFVLLCRGVFCSSDRILLSTKGGLESFPHAAFGLGFPLQGHDSLPLLAADLAHQRVEHVVDVIAEGGRGLEEGAAEFPGQGRAFLFGHLQNKCTGCSGKPNPSSSFLPLPVSLYGHSEPQDCFHPALFCSGNVRDSGHPQKTKFKEYPFF